MLPDAKYKHDHSLTRKCVMLIANNTAPLLGSKSQAMKEAWAFVKKGGTVTNAVGVTFGGCQNVLRCLEQHPIQDVGYLLQREPDNPYDANAIRVDGYLLGRCAGQAGHLPRDLAAVLAPLMDAGVPFHVPQHAIYGGWGQGVSLGVKLRIRFANNTERSEQKCLNATA